MAGRQKMRRLLKEFALEEEHARQQDTQRVAYLQRLKVEGVDLTKYLTSQNQRSDKLVRIETDADTRCADRGDQLLKYSAYYMWQQIVRHNENLVAQHLTRLRSLVCTDMQLWWPK